jgi:PEP-CTERM motif
MKFNQGEVMKSIVAAAAVALTALGASPAFAGTTVVYEGTETTDWANLWESLPGYGSYTFEFTASAPVAYTLIAEYDYHWDVFLAPAPRPHNENIEGSNDLTGTTWSATGTSFTHVFHVGKMSRTGFVTGDEYLGWGIQPGTRMYRETKYENPYFEFWADRKDGSDFTYTFKVTQFASVPEPATWAMMIIGFGGVGAMVRRGRGARAARFA